MCVCVCVYVCVCVCVCVRARACVQAFICTHIHTHTCMCTFMCANTCPCKCTYKSSSTCTCKCFLQSTKPHSADWPARNKLKQLHSLLLCHSLHKVPEPLKVQAHNNKQTKKSIQAISVTVMIFEGNCVQTKAQLKITVKNSLYVSIKNIVVHCLHNSLTCLMLSFFVFL